MKNVGQSLFKNSNEGVQVLITGKYVLEKTLYSGIFYVVNMYI